MTKLSNGVEYYNPHFKKEFGEYLLANCFACRNVKDTISFIKDGLELYFKGDAVDMFTYIPEEPGQEFEKWVFTASHTGISLLDIFLFILLMHAMRVQPIETAVPNAARLSEQQKVEMEALIRETLYSLKKIAA